MRRSPLIRLSTLAALLALLALVAVGLAAADPVTVVAPARVSGLSPIADCAIGGPGINYVNAAVEPRIAVNPTNPKNLVGVWQQDRWSNGGAHGLVTAVTHDGGATWARTWAHFSLCAGGDWRNG